MHRRLGETFVIFLVTVHADVANFFAIYCVWSGCIVPCFSRLWRTSCLCACSLKCFVPQALLGLPSLVHAKQSPNKLYYSFLPVREKCTCCSVLMCNWGYLYICAAHFSISNYLLFIECHTKPHKPFEDLADRLLYFYDVP